jgi:hypothetical protein
VGAVTEDHPPQANSNHTRIRPTVNRREQIFSAEMPGEVNLGSALDGQFVGLIAPCFLVIGTTREDG